MRRWERVVYNLGPHAWYPMFELSGTVCNDQTNTVSAGSYAGAGMAGKVRGLLSRPRQRGAGDVAPEFSATNTQSVDLNNGTISSQQTNVSYVIAFRGPVAGASVQSLYAEGRSSAGNPVFMFNRPSTSATGLRIFQRTNTGTTLQDLVGAIPVWDQRPHVMVYTDANGTYNLYVDGALDLSGSYTRGSLTLDRCRIGARNANGVIDLYLEGVIEDVAVYRKILSPGDALALWDAFKERASRRARHAA